MIGKEAFADDVDADLQHVVRESMRISDAAHEGGIPAGEIPGVVGLIRCQMAKPNKS